MTLTPAPSEAVGRCVRDLLREVGFEPSGSERHERADLGMPPPEPSPVGASPDPALAARLRARIDERAPAILACVGGDAAAVSLRWAASGAVTLGIRGERDQAVIDCARAAAGPLEVAAGTQPGTLLHALTR